MSHPNTFVLAILFSTFCGTYPAEAIGIPARHMNATGDWWNGEKKIFSGLFIQSETKVCERTCYKYMEASQSYYPLLTLDGLCFCTNGNAFLDENLLSDISSDQTVCTDNDISYCIWSDYVIVRPFTIMKDYTIDIDSDIEVPKNVTFNFHRTYIGTNVPGGFEIDYSNQLMNLSLAYGKSYNVLFMQPGYSKMFVKTEQDSQRVFQLYAVANFSVAFFDIPTSVNLTWSKPTHFTLGFGTNITVNGNYFADINIISNLVESKLISESASTPSSALLPGYSYFVFHTLFYEDGLLSFIEVNIASGKTGSKIFKIITLVCDSGLCPDDTRSGSELNRANLFTLEKTQISYKVSRFFIVNFDNDGHQVIDVRELKIYIPKLSFLAFHHDGDNEAQFMLLPDVKSYYKNDGTEQSFVPNDPTFESALQTEAPAIKLYIAKDFTVRVSQSSNADSKIKHEVTLSSPMLQTTFALNKDTYNVKAISSVNFAAKEPIITSEGQYDIETKYFRCTAEYEKLSDVKVVFYFFGLNLMFTKPDQNYATVPTRSFSPGNFTLTVVISNRASSMYNIEEISFLEKIRKLSFHASKTYFQLGSSTELSVFIDGGSRVFLQVDHNDGIKNEMFYVNPLKKEYFNITYQYKACGLYKSTAAAQNALMDNPVSSFIEISVLCPLQDLKLNTVPLPLSTGEIPILISYQLELIVAVASGSFVEYSVNWGDGTSVMWKDDTLLPRAKTLFHKFPSEKNYDVVVTAKMLKTTLVKNLKVNVKACTPPILDFSFGTEKSRMNITKAGRFLQASWVYVNDFCKNAQVYYPMEWILQNNTVISRISATKMANSDSTEYSVPAKNLEVGPYDLHLVMKYTNKTISYTAYLNIIELALFAVTDLGSLKDVPKFLLTKDSEIPYIFKISGKQSYDPENRPGSFSYKWHCKVNSAREEVNLMRLNITTKLLCLSDDFEELEDIYGGSTDLLFFNTSLFLEAISYTFQLTVKKDSRTSKAIGRINILAGSPPSIQIECQSNCLEKIDTMEQVQYQLACTFCLRSLVVVGYWTLRYIENGKMKVVGEEAFNSKPNSVNLAIRSGALKINTDYFLDLEAYYSSRPHSKSKLTIQRKTADIPYKGHCREIVSKGYVLEPVFGFECFDWVNDEGETFYDFYYDTMEKPKVQVTTAGGSNFRLFSLPENRHKRLIKNVTLPIGLKEFNYTLKIIVKISNRFHSYFLYDRLKVQVLPKPIAKSKDSADSGASFNNALNELSAAADKKPASVQEASSIAQGVISALANVKSELNDQQVVDPLTGVVDEKTQAKLDEEKKKTQEATQKMVGTLIQNFDAVTPTNLEDVTKTFETMAAISDDPANLNEETATAAVDVAEKQIEQLVQFAASSGPEEIQQSCKPVVSAMANLLGKEMSIEENLLQKENEIASVDSKNNVEEVKNISSKKEKAEKSIKKINGMISRVGGTILDKKVIGEEATVIKLPILSLALSRLYAFAINASTHGADGGYGTSLPDFHAFGLEASDPVDIQSLNYKKSPFVWANNSADVKSEIIGYSMKLEGGKNVTLQNVSNPIKVAMKNNIQGSAAKVISLAKPRTYKTVSIPLTKTCNFLLDINILNDVKNETTLFVYIQYGILPSKKNYDILFKISNSEGVNVQQNTEPSKQVHNNKTLYFKRRSFISRNSDNSFLLSNLDEFTLASLVKDNAEKYLHFVFVYFGPLPPIIHTDNPYTYDTVESRGAFNYSFNGFCASCGAWDGSNNVWSSDSMMMDSSATSLQSTSCATKQTEKKSFGGLFVSPNPLPAFSFALLKEGFVLLTTVLAILLLWILGTVATRRFDKKDELKIGVCPMIDNKLEDPYLYEITVNTGTRSGSETESNVYIVVSGDKGNTTTRILKDPNRQSFQKSGSDVFIMKTADWLGELNYIRLWHDNSGGDWYVRSVEIVDLTSDQKYLFLATRWLAVDKHDGMLDCIVVVASKKELQDFTYLFTTKAQQDFSDVHVWYSIYARPPRSVFTRTQRLAVAISLLFCSMTASLMFYGAIPDGSAAEENRIGGFKFTWAQVYVAAITVCITVPINLILTGLFRSIRPKKQATQKSHSDCEEQHPPEQMDTPIIRKKEKKSISFPHWVLIPTWILCVIVILGSGFMVVWYGMAFGNKKSLDWLASVTISLCQDIILMQPVKVFVVAVFVGIVVKKVDNEEKSETEKQAKFLVKDESWLNKMADGIDMFDRVEEIEPPDMQKVNWMREARIKERKMHAIIREIVLYAFFAIVVFLVGFLNRETSTFYQTQSIEELISLRTREGTALEPKQQFKMILSYNDFWPWLDRLFLHQVFPDPWYKLDPRYSDTPDVRDFPGRYYLNDLTSKVVNGIRFRQVRVKPGSCVFASEVEGFMTQGCSSDYGSSQEETRHFRGNWSLPYNESEGQPPLSASSKPWTYQSWDQLDGYPFWAELNIYFGGGYVVEIFPKWQNRKILKGLQEKKWIDRYTRAVLIEFTIYNAATNYFTAVTVVAEFPPGGGTVPYFQVNTFQLYRYANHNKLFVISCEVLFLLLMLIFTYREFRLFQKMKWSYFKEFWNIVEISNIVLTVIACGIYVYREILATKLLEKLPEKKPNIFINFQLAATYGSIFTYVIALICFFVTLKFIKLLRFNRRISLLSYTLKRAWYPLSMFGICFGTVIIAVIFSSSIIFGSHLYGYRDIYQTVASIIGLLLGKFSYEQFENSNRTLGPIFFMAFNIMVNIVIMNMMISILDDCFKEVQEELLAQKNDYEIVDFILSKLKTWLGFGHAKTFGEREWEERSFLEEREPERTHRQSRSEESLNSNKTATTTSEVFMPIADESHWLNTDTKHLFLEPDMTSNDETDDEAGKFIECFTMLTKKSQTNLTKSANDDSDWMKSSNDDSDWMNQEMDDDLYYQSDESECEILN